jgi:putative transposase
MTRLFRRWRQIKAGFLQTLCRFSSAQCQQDWQVRKGKFGSVASENIKFAMNRTCSGMWITSTTTPGRYGIVSRTADWPYSSFHRFVRSGDLPLDWTGHSKAEGSLLGGELD